MIEGLLESATIEDYCRAVHPDGTPVRLDIVLAANTFHKRYEDVTKEDLLRSMYARQYRSKSTRS